METYLGCDTFLDALTTAVADLTVPLSWNEFQKLAADLREGKAFPDAVVDKKELSKLRRACMEEKFGHDWLKLVPQSALAERILASVAEASAAEGADEPLDGGNGAVLDEGTEEVRLQQFGEGTVSAVPAAGGAFLGLAPLDPRAPAVIPGVQVARELQDPRVSAVLSENQAIDASSETSSLCGQRVRGLGVSLAQAGGSTELVNEVARSEMLKRDYAKQFLAERREPGNRDVPSSLQAWSAAALEARSYLSMETAQDARTSLFALADMAMVRPEYIMEGLGLIHAHYAQGAAPGPASPAPRAVPQEHMIGTPPRSGQGFRSPDGTPFGGLVPSPDRAAGTDTEFTGTERTPQRIAREDARLVNALRSAMAADREEARQQGEGTVSAAPAASGTPSPAPANEQIHDRLNALMGLEYKQT